jgi:hypothetical protein
MQCEHRNLFQLEVKSILSLSLGVFLQNLHAWFSGCSGCIFGLKQFIFIHDLESEELTSIIFVFVNLGNHFGTLLGAILVPFWRQM